MTHPTPISRQLTLEQARAQFAWECVAQMRTNDKKKEYGQLARGGAADIQINGLGQTLAFWRAKSHSDKGHKELLNDISQWLQQQLHFSGTDAVEWIANTASTDEYRRATAEAIAVLIWIKRFAEAELID